ncbi:MAG: beta-galactosidase [Spartobacteria bacterium]
MKRSTASCSTVRACFWALLVLAIVPWSAVLASKSGPPIRTGLWVMQKLPDNSRSFEEFSSGIKTNPNLTGVCLHIPWEWIEKESGKPDFSAIDKTVAVLRGIGMKYQLCLKPGAFTPAFVYTDGAKAFETRVHNPRRANAGAAIKIPVPWDPVYLRDYERIIQALGKRYANDPLCVSVVLTGANYMSAEMHLPKTRTDLTRWQALGDYETLLLEAYKKYVDMWGAAFPKQEISLHLSKVLDLPPSFCERIIDYGLDKYPERFTIQNCQLTGRKEDGGVMSYDLVQKYRDRAHHGFQSLAGLSRPNERMGSIEMAALNVVHADGEYWELWHGDGFNVETSSAVARIWQEAKDLGYDAYKKKLMSEGKYRQQR